MNQNEEYYQLLAEKWLNGTITEAEKADFLYWYQQDLDAHLSIDPSFVDNEDALQARIFNKIQERKRGRVASFSFQRYWIAAACLLMIILSGTIFLRNSKHEVTPLAKQVEINNAVAPLIHPGGNAAILTLSNGSKIILDSTGKGLVAHDQNSTIIKLDDGKLAYNAKNGNTEVSYNTLSTPVGGQYMLVLADGTKVWLNSSSSLHFPTAFIGKERIVELEGEGYFEVAKDAAMPFKVKVGKRTVQVLGTHFNVMAYQDEEAMQTTLLEGSVQVQDQHTAVTIIPGQQAVSNGTGKLSVRNHVNLEQVVAWKNGLFQFEQSDLTTITRQLTRWYGVSFVNPDGVTGHFSGNIPKAADLDKVLHMLELTGVLHFKIKGKQVWMHH